MADLEFKRRELAVIMKKLDLLNDQLRTKQSEQKDLEDKLIVTKDKLHRAEKLTNGLGTEKARWNGQVEYLTHTFDHIVGDVLLSSGVVAYLGAFTCDYRQVC